MLRRNINVLFDAGTNTLKYITQKISYSGEIGAGQCQIVSCSVPETF